MSLVLQESALSEALARLAGDIDQKLDRLELDPLKDYFGEFWRYFLKYILSCKLDYQSCCSGKGPFLREDLPNRNRENPGAQREGYSGIHQGRYCRSKVQSNLRE